MSLLLRKLDLHVHTPASHDFADKSITAEQIIEHAQTQGLDAIAITDHNTVDFIDIAKEAAKKKKFIIFPGVEISCGGSANGSIHVVALFDPSKSRDDLQRVLGKLDIKGTGEKALTPKSVSDVIDIIREAGGLPVLAHANSSHGALSDIKGNPRVEIVQNKNLLAVEATEADFKKAEGKRLVDVLKGSDPVYKRLLAVYKASDNRIANGTGHSLGAIGSSFSYFKMGELSVESLRQCFEDPASRIIQDYETEKLNIGHPRIESMSISGGFLDGQKIVFDPSMNSVIGGTGTGKSLVVEYLRFAFGLKPHPVLMLDHREKLEKQLRINGVVTVEFRDTSGDQYEVVRTYDNPKHPYASSFTCINKTTSRPYTGDIKSILPLLIYSQNEILEITRDPKAQLRLLDMFRDFEAYQINIQKIEQELGNLDRQLYQAAENSANLESLLKQQGTIKEKIDKVKRKLNETGKKGVTSQYLQLSEERTLIESAIEGYDTLLEHIADAIEVFETAAPAKPKAPKDLVDQIGVDLNGNYVNIIESLRKNEQLIVKARVKSEAALLAWDKTNKFKELEKQYQSEIKQQEKQEQAEADRKSLVSDKKDIDLEVEDAKNAAALYAEIRKQRNVVLKNLEKSKSQYFKERAEQADLITLKSEGRLKIVVQKGDSKTTYEEMLSRLKVGSHAEKKEIEVIIDKTSPIDLVEIVLDRDVKRLATEASLTESKAEGIVNELSSPVNLQETLSMQYKGYPEDRIEISYQKNDGSFYPLSELSMGQKADALIMIALGDSNMPVIIDQPEDALDLPSIWSDICSKLRIAKHSRQFLFTTHNSSISVSSDSDRYIILQADGKKGKVLRSGSIDQQQIKDDVVGHLEGGYSSYELKRKKYGLDQKKY